MFLDAQIDFEIQPTSKNIEVSNEDNNESQKHLTITKLDIQNCSIFTKVESEIHPLLITSDSDKFMEFYLWNKRYGFNKPYI